MGREKPGLGREGGCRLAQEIRVQRRGVSLPGLPSSETDRRAWTLPESSTDPLLLQRSAGISRLTVPKARAGSGRGWGEACMAALPAPSLCLPEVRASPGPGLCSRSRGRAGSPCCPPCCRAERRREAWLLQQLSPGPAAPRPWLAGPFSVCAVSRLNFPVSRFFFNHCGCILGDSRVPRTTSFSGFISV